MYPSQILWRGLRKEVEFLIAVVPKGDKVWVVIGELLAKEAERAYGRADPLNLIRVMPAEGDLQNLLLQGVLGSVYPETSFLVHPSPVSGS